jgi:hypothetical protein
MTRNHKKNKYVVVCIALLPPYFTKYISQKYSPKCETDGVGIIKLGKFIENIKNKKYSMDVEVVCDRNGLNDKKKFEKIELGSREISILENKNLQRTLESYKHHDDYVILSIERLSEFAKKRGYKKDNITFPGGKPTHYSEAFWETCWREFLEEIGIDISSSTKKTCALCSDKKCHGFCTHGKNIRGEDLRAFIVEDLYLSLADHPPGITNLLRDNEHVTKIDESIEARDVPIINQEPIIEFNEIIKHKEIEPINIAMQPNHCIDPIQYPPIMHPHPQYMHPHHQYMHPHPQYMHPHPQCMPPYFVSPYYVPPPLYVPQPYYMPLPYSIPPQPYYIPQQVYCMPPNFINHALVMQQEQPIQ